MRTVKVLVGDAQALFASSVATAISTVPGLEAFEKRPETWSEALSLITRLRPEVALLDLWLHGSPLSAADPDSRQRQEDLRIRLQEAGCKLIILSWMQSQEHIQSALEAGAIGFLTKSTSAADLFDAIKKAYRGQPLVQGDELFHLVDRMEEKRLETESIMERLGALSPPELEVIIQLSHGRSPQEIAQHLYVSHSTVKARIHSILAKTGARSRAEVLAEARRCGLIQS